jgi:uncharacterized protein (DUF1697 family)
MKTYISMLRGVNVGGKTMHMTDLRGLYESLDLKNVETYVQSGNVVFDTAVQDIPRWVGLLEGQIRLKFGYSVSIIIRETGDFQRVITTNPFLQGRSEDPLKLHVTFLQQPPSAMQWTNLKIPDPGPDEFSPGKEEVFLFCPGGYGRTKLSNTFFEKQLNMPATTRNWNTVNTLFQMANKH